MYLSYVMILKYAFFCLSLVLILFFLSFFLVPRIYDEEKISIYECGFSPYGDSRTRFEVKFYLVAILFILFDLELTFLFPWIIVFFSLHFFGIFIMFFFLIVLFLGFVYELTTGSLDWNVS